MVSTDIVRPFPFQATTYGEYRRLKAEEGEEQGEEQGEVEEYAGLVGHPIARRMLLYRQG